MCNPPTVQCSVMNIHSFPQLPSLSNGFCCYVNNRFYNLFCCQCVDFKIRILCRNWHCCIFRLTVTLSQATELCHPPHNRRPVTQPTAITGSYIDLWHIQRLSTEWCWQLEITLLHKYLQSNMFLTRHNCSAYYALQCITVDLWCWHPIRQQCNETPHF